MFLYKTPTLVLYNMNINSMTSMYMRGKSLQKRRTRLFDNDFLTFLWLLWFFAWFFNFFFYLFVDFFMTFDFSFWLSSFLTSWLCQMRTRLFQVIYPSDIYAITSLYLYQNKLSSFSTECRCSNWMYSRLFLYWTHEGPKNLLGSLR